MIKPTNGRVVWYTPATNDADIAFLGAPLTAHIVHVHNDREVNLMVIDAVGVTHPRLDVTLVQPGDPVNGLGRFCEWMPYQKGQAAKHDLAATTASGPADTASNVAALFAKREITTHVVAANTRDHVRVFVMDDDGPGGAPHAYDIAAPGMMATQIRFQKGAIQEAGINGITNEALLAVVIDRLRKFQTGPFACEENALALGHAESALAELISRTKMRLARGVEGRAIA